MGTFQRATGTLVFYIVTLLFEYALRGKFSEKWIQLSIEI